MKIIIRTVVPKTEYIAGGDLVTIVVGCPECYADSEQTLLDVNGVADGDCYCPQCGEAWKASDHYYDL